MALIMTPLGSEQLYLNVTNSYACGAVVAMDQWTCTTSAFVAGGDLIIRGTGPLSALGVTGVMLGYTLIRPMPPKRGGSRGKTRTRA